MASASRAVGRERPTPLSPAQKGLPDCRQPAPPEGGPARERGPLTQRGLGARPSPLLSPGGCTALPQLGRGLCPGHSQAASCELGLQRAGPAPTRGPGSSVQPRARGLKAMAKPRPLTQSTEYRPSQHGRSVRPHRLQLCRTLLPVPPSRAHVCKHLCVHSIHKHMHKCVYVQKHTNRRVRCKNKRVHTCIRTRTRVHTDIRVRTHGTCRCRYRGA